MANLYTMGSDLREPDWLDRSDRFGANLYTGLNAARSPLIIGSQIATRAGISDLFYQTAIEAIEQAVRAFEPKAERARGEYYGEIWAESRRPIPDTIAKVDAALTRTQAAIAETAKEALKFDDWQGGTTEAYETHRMRRAFEGREVRDVIRSMSLSDAKASLELDVAMNRYDRVGHVLDDPTGTIASFLGQTFVDTLRKRVVERRAPEGTAHLEAHHLKVVADRLRDAARAGTDRPPVLR